MTGAMKFKFLHECVTFRQIPGVGALDMHVLEAGPEDGELLLLLHGFPELSYSWRKVMPLLADAGYRVVAPDQRGYGLTRGWTQGYDVDLAEFGPLQLSADIAALVERLGRSHAKAVIGHDFGASVTAWCALTRPDMFRAAMLMSAPFGGPPGMTPGPAPSYDDDLLALSPPRKHYKQYYHTAAAEPDMMNPPEGFAAFLRAYFHCKSADWPGNAPYPLADWAAATTAVMPRYYIMNAADGMAATALSMAPPPGSDCAWLTDGELAVYVDCFQATGLQGGLNWYRSVAAPNLDAWAGRRIEVPIAFAAGAADWGTWQAPGALESFETRVSTDYRGRTLIDGAGHWVQQEKPRETAAAILNFLSGL